MKLKYTLIPAVLAAVLALAACGGTTTPTTPDETQPTEITTETPDETQPTEITTEAPAEEPTEEATEVDETAELRAAFEEHAGKTDFRETMVGDKTGNWRVAVVSILEGDLLDYAAEYAAAYINPGEVHFLIPFSGDYTLLLNLYGDQLMVTRLEHIEGMDYNAEHVNDGEVLNDYIINMSTGEIREVSE